MAHQWLTLLGGRFGPLKGSPFSAPITVQSKLEPNVAARRVSHHGARFGLLFDSTLLGNPDLAPRWVTLLGNNFAPMITHLLSTRFVSIFYYTLIGALLAPRRVEPKAGPNLVPRSVNNQVKGGAKSDARFGSTLLDPRFGSPFANLTLKGVSQI